MAGVCAGKWTDVLLTFILLPFPSYVVRLSIYLSPEGSPSKHQDQQIVHHLWDGLLCGILGLQVSVGQGEDHLLAPRVGGKALIPSPQQLVTFLWERPAPFKA